MTGHNQRISAVLAAVLLPVAAFAAFDSHTVAFYPFNEGAANESSPKLSLRGFTTTCVSIVAPKITDGRWHHVAMTMDPSRYLASQGTADAVVYFDGMASSVGAVTFYKGSASNNYTTTNTRHYWFVRGDRRNDVDPYCHAFNGLIDEIRMTRGLLDPSEFLVQKGDLGSMIMVR